MNKHTRRRRPTNPSFTALAARKTLSDARAARTYLKNAIEASSVVQTRIAWITCLTLLRAVGHVLDKVDAERSAYLRRASKDVFSAARADRFSNLIFWEFIHAERNGLLKEYKSSIFDSEDDPDHPGKRRLILTNVLVGMEFFTPVQAVEASITWWNIYIARVEDLALAYGSSS